MNNKERAKQFLPFDALKGLTEALREREERRTRVEKKQLSEDMAEELSLALSEVEVGTAVRITFYSDGHYLDLEGTVTEIDAIYRRLRIGGERIRFDDILRLTLL